MFKLIINKGNRNEYYNANSEWTARYIAERFCECNPDVIDVTIVDMETGVIPCVVVREM